LQNVLKSKDTLSCGNSGFHETLKQS